jgi:asparagine synthase (glutamine-hydrolysing)
MGEPVNELSYARMVADRYKTDHHELLVDGKEVPDLIAKVMWHLEEPVSMSEIATYAIGRAVSDHVKVLLCGDGADEVFGGYVRFQPINLCAMLPNAVLKWGYVRGMNGFTLADRRRLYSAEQREFMGPNSNGPLDEAFAENHDSLLNRLLRYELGTQLRSQLIRLDKMTMAHSVEARVPFLDTELVSYVANLPSRLKVRGFREKVLLKLAMADRLPEAVVNRRKLGWSNPVKSLFRGSFKDICREQLNASRDVVSRYFSVRGVDKLYTAVGRPSVLRIPEQKLFHLYLFIKWHEMFIEGAAPPEAVAATKAAR